MASKRTPKGKALADVLRFNAILLVVVAVTSCAQSPAADVRPAAVIESSPYMSTRTQIASQSTQPLNAVQNARVVQNYGSLPLAFEANRGQTDHRVKFLALRL